MSHFYAKISQSARRTTPTARGHGIIETIAAGWDGAIRVTLKRGYEGESDTYIIDLLDWPTGTLRKSIKVGSLNEKPARKRVVKISKKAA